MGQRRPAISQHAQTPLYPPNSLSGSRLQAPQKNGMQPGGQRFAADKRAHRRAKSGRTKRTALHPAEKGLRGMDY